MPTTKTSDGVQPGDLPDLIGRLRRWSSDRDSDAYLIEGSFEPYGLEVEALAARARPLVQAAADAVFQLVLALEKTPDYKRQARKDSISGSQHVPGPER